MNRESPHQRRRILLVIAGLGPGGAERQMALLARTLNRNRFEVGLLIFNAGERVHYPDVFEQLPVRAFGRDCVTSSAPYHGINKIYLQHS